MDQSAGKGRLIHHWERGVSRVQYKGVFRGGGGWEWTSRRAREDSSTTGKEE